MSIQEYYLPNRKKVGRIEQSLNSKGESTVASDLDVQIALRNTRGWPRTARQLDWANFHILEGLSAHQAAIKAGYTAQTSRAKSFELPKKLLVP